MTQEALKLALEALEKNTKHLPADFDYHFEAITAIKEALANHIEDNLAMVAAQPEQEPVPPPWWTAVENILNEYGLQAIDFVADFKKALAQTQEPVTLPDSMTPEMLKKVQMFSELGAYAAENWAGAYDTFQEFWQVAISALPAAPQRTEQVCCQKYDTCLEPCTPRGEHLAQRKPLTDDQIWDAYWKAPVDIECPVSDLYTFARAIEAKLKEKNT